MRHEWKDTTAVDHLKRPLVRCAICTLVFTKGFETKDGVVECLGRLPTADEVKEYGIRHNNYKM